MLAMLVTWKVKAALAAALVVAVLAYHAVAVSGARKQGYDNAMDDVEKINAVAGKELRQAIESGPRACRDRGGAWDQHRGLCDTGQVRHRFGFL